MNSKLILIPVGIIIAIVGAYVGLIPSDDTEISQIEETIGLHDSRTLIQTNVNSLFKVFAYDDDFEMIDGKKIWRNVYYELDEFNSDIYTNLKNNKKSAVVFPIFTAAAYSEPVSYTHLTLPTKA